MSAPDNAHTLRDEGYYKDDVFLDNDLIICDCGYEGTAGGLLCVDDEETLWCPQCKTAGWQWK